MLENSDTGVSGSKINTNSGCLRHFELIYGVEMLKVSRFFVLNELESRAGMTRACARAGQV